MKVRSLRVRANGIQQHVRVCGDGPALVLIHGWPETSYCWRKVIGPLSRDFTVIAPDLRGFGGTDKPAGGYDKRTCARDVRALSKALGFERAFVAGHDIGARVAFRLALDHESFVERLVIIAGRYPPLGTDRMFEPKQALERWYFFFHQLPELPEKLVGSNVRAYITHFLRHWAHDPATFSRGELAEYVKEFSRPGALRGGFNHYRAAMKQDVPVWRRDAGRQIAVPTLVLWGRDDPVSPPSWATGFDTVFKDLTIHMVARCGHFVHEEHPEVTIRKVRQFLRGNSA